MRNERARSQYPRIAITGVALVHQREIREVPFSIGVKHLDDLLGSAVEFVVHEMKQSAPRTTTIAASPLEPGDRAGTTNTSVK